MNLISCCRTCLGQQSLHPIFVHSEYSEKYSDLINLSAGVKVEINDNLPQLMCTDCIAFVNECKVFRKKCENAQKLLLDNNLDNLKLEQTQALKVEYDKATQIDISEFLHNDDDFKDYDDNVTLDLLQCNSDSSHKTSNELENEATIEMDMASTDNSRVKRTNVKMKPERIKTKLKIVPKTGKNDSERIKEEIECEYCHKILTSKLSLRNHYKIHTGFDVVCEHCGKKFITRRLLLMHCRAKHGYEKTDKCSFCEYRASNAEQVKIHERLHTGERPFVCKECGAGFHRKSSYLQHVAIHLPEKTVQCAQCPARFKSTTLMRIHAQRHRAPRYAFKCGACAGTFARRRNAARHLQRVHALPPHQGHIERLQLL